MANLKKRLEALAELFYSEKAYVNDLRLWQTSLRKKIYALPRVNKITKQNICKSIFINMDEIYLLHLQILREMRVKNESIIKRYPEAFESYQAKQEKVREEYSQTRASCDDGMAGIQPEMLNGVDFGFRLETLTHDKQIRLELETLEFGIEKDSSMDVSTLEYASILLNNIENFRCYEKYASHLPKSEYEFDRSMYRYARFNDIINEYMKENEVELIGTKNFIYRPSSKLARYPLLLKAILKNEPNKEYAKLYERIIGKINRITKRIDHVFQASSDFFMMFLLSDLLKYSPNVNYRPFLELIFRRTRLIKESKIIFKSAAHQPATYKQMFLFQKAVIFCGTIDNLYEPVPIMDMPLFLNRLTVIRKPLAIFAKDAKLDALYPIYLIRKSENIKKAIYFEDQSTRDLHYKIFAKLIFNLHKRHRKTAGIQQRLALSKDDLYCVCSTVNKNLSLNVLPADLEFKLKEQKKVGDESSEMYNKDSRGETCDGTSSGSESDRSDSTSKSDGDSSESVNGTQRYGIRHTKQCDRIDVFMTKDSSEESLPSDFSSDSWEDVISTTADNPEFLLNDFLDEKPEPGQSLVSGHLHDSTVETPSADDEDASASWCHGVSKGIFMKPEFYFSSMKFEKPPSDPSSSYIHQKSRMIIYSTSRGIYRRIGDDIALVSTMPATKLAYDAEAELLFCQIGSKLYLSRFNHLSEELDSQLFPLSITSFFYGIKGDCKTVVLASSRDFGFSLIYLLEVRDDGSHLCVEFKKKLYVGSVVSSIYFLEQKIVIACKNFELIEASTLQTQSLLEYYDPLTQDLMFRVGSSRAKNIFRVKNDVYLLCFDKLGFYVSPTGCYLNEKPIFNWECTAHSFRIYHTFILVLSASHLSLFSLETGEMVYFNNTPNLRFVECVNTMLLYDKTKLYRFYDTVLEEITPSENVAESELMAVEPEQEVEISSASDKASESSREPGHDGSLLVPICQAPAINAEAESESISSVCSEDSIIKVLEAAACTDSKPLRLITRGDQSGQDACSDDVCLQHYSQALRTRPKKKRKRRRMTICGLIGWCCSHKTGRQLREERAEHNRESIPAYIAQSKFKHSAALVKLNIRKDTGGRSRLPVNKNISTQLPTDLQNRFASFAIRPNIASNLNDADVESHTERTSSSRAASSEVDDSTCSSLAQIATNYESSSAGEIIAEYMQQKTLVLRSKKDEEETGT